MRVITRCELGKPGEILGRISCDDIDGSAGRVAPVERPLSAPEHLNPFHVIKARQRSRWTCHKHAVDVECYWIFRAKADSGEADASERDVCCAVGLTNL